MTTAGAVLTQDSALLRKITGETCACYAAIGNPYKVKTAFVIVDNNIDIRRTYNSTMYINNNNNNTEV